MPFNNPSNLLPFGIATARQVLKPTPKQAVSITSQRYSKHPPTKHLYCPTCNCSRPSTAEGQSEESREQTQGHLAMMKSLKSYK